MEHKIDGDLDSEVGYCLYSPAPFVAEVERCVVNETKGLQEEKKMVPKLIPLNSTMENLIPIFLCDGRQVTLLYTVGYRLRVPYFLCAQFESLRYYWQKC